MSYINLILPEGCKVCDGKHITFRSPIESDQVEGLCINNEYYDIYDCYGRKLEETYTLEGERYSEGDLLTVMLDKTNKKAHLLYTPRTHSPAFTGNLSLNRKSGTELGEYSTVLGEGNEVSGNNSFAIGHDNTVNSFASFAGGGFCEIPDGCSYSFAFGNSACAQAHSAIAMGYAAVASAEEAVAIGCHAQASGWASTAVNHETVASGSASFAAGYGTEALTGQFALGHYNDKSKAKAGVNEGTGTGTAFVIGNGTSSTKSNAFRIDFNGTPYSKAALNTTGADYAEFFEWLDKNVDKEDRRGYFVTLDGESIKKAEPGDYILGIVSGMPSIIGNGDEDWRGRYITDDFGAFIYEEFEYQDIVGRDKETKELITVTRKGLRYKENPDYDESLEYIQRADRPEWDAVGMLGIIPVRDDGTCKVNGFCTVTTGGIATASTEGYRVVSRVSDNIVKVVFR